MTNFPFDTKSAHRHKNSKILAGALVIVFGTLFLIERQGVAMPDWVISWKTILIAVGIVHLYKHGAKKIWGWIMLGVGVVLIVKDLHPQYVDTGLILPVIIILIGISMITKHTNLFGSKKTGHHSVWFDDEKGISSEDYVQSSTYFGGVHKNIVSKSFKGADFTTAFGGIEINLMKADMQEPAKIKASTYFGGMVLIVPNNWQIQSDITTIAGSVEDQRSLPSDVAFDPNKVLILEGTCLFGGVEIRSYS